MNILIVNNYYYPYLPGGTEHSVKLLAEGLVSRGHSVTIMTYDAYPHAEVSESINGVSVKRFMPKHFVPAHCVGRRTIAQRISSKLVEIFNSEIERQIASVLSSDAFDLVHVNNTVGMSRRLWALLSEAEIPIVHTLRDYYLLDARYTLDPTPNVLNRLYRQAMRKATNVSGIAAVTAPSEFTLQAFLNAGYFTSARSACIPNAIAYDEHIQAKAMNEKRMRQGSPTYLFVGALSEHKGVLQLQKAFDSIPRLECALKICGDGPLRGIVEQWAREDERIEYCGKLAKNELEQRYASSDVLIVPSVWDEPFGRILIEGFQYGLPAIVSNRGGMSEIIKKTGAGSLYPSDNVGELARAIRRFSDRNTIISYLDLMPRASSFYSLEKQLDSFERLFTCVCDSK